VKKINSHFIRCQIVTFALVTFMPRCNKLASYIYTFICTVMAVGAYLVNYAQEYSSTMLKTLSNSAYVMYRGYEKASSEEQY